MCWSVTSLQRFKKLVQIKMRITKVNPMFMYIGDAFFFKKKKKKKKKFKLAHETSATN